MSTTSSFPTGFLVVFEVGGRRERRRFSPHLNVVLRSYVKVLET